MNTVCKTNEITGLNLDDTILNVTELLFSNKIQEMLQNVLLILDRVEKLRDFFSAHEVDTLDQILNYIFIAIENKDYLFISDILTYEFLPFVKKHDNGGVANDNI